MCFYRQEQFLQDKELAFQRKSGFEGPQNFRGQAS